MTFRCIDFETTGLPDSEGDAAICEIGWCDIDSEVSPPKSLFVNPGQPMPPEARAVHHISDDDVVNAVPQHVGLALMARSSATHFIAHNAKFEQAFFATETPWICTYKVALRMWPDAPSHSNQVLRYWLGLELGDESLAMPPHRAGPDAYVTAHLFALMLKDETVSIEDMVLWSSGPPLLPKVTFGKHRGSRWEDVPRDYLDWIVNKSDMDNDIKANARHHLKGGRK